MSIYLHCRNIIIIILLYCYILLLLNLYYDLLDNDSIFKTYDKAMRIPF